MSLIEEFAADQQLRGLTPRSIEGNVCRVRNWLTWCEKRSTQPQTAKREDFLAYLQTLQERGHKSETLKKDFSGLTAFYEFLEDRNESSTARDVVAIRKKYLRRYKSDSEQRQLISIEDAARMVALTIETRDRAMLLMLLKTGIRKGELLSLDTSDVDMMHMSIRLKPTPKRSNRIVFFDEECREALSRWLKVRASRTGSDGPLWLNYSNQRLGDAGLKKSMRKAGTRAGVHDPDGPLEERFSAHCCRHWFTTHLLRSGMRREYVQFLRGDAIKEAVDIYYHIDPEDVRRAYLACIPRLGV